MKKILSLLGTITLIGISTSNIYACELKNFLEEYTPEQLKKLKEKNNIKTNDGILEWIAPQEKPFNEVDNKYYYVVWRGNKNNDWKLSKFKNDNFKTIDKFNNFELQILPPKNKVIFGLLIGEKQDWGFKPIKRWIDDKNNNYFKAVYRWNLDTQEPNLIIDDNGIVKVKGE